MAERDIDFSLEFRKKGKKKEGVIPGTSRRESGRDNGGAVQKNILGSEGGSMSIG